MILPTSAQELRRALEEGLLPEGHYIDFKREVSAGRSANRELARDLASFAIDGGQLILGVEEDKEARRFIPHPITLTGLAERVSQVSITVIDPGLQVRCHELIDNATAEGFLIIDVPVSPQAPHQVDSKFWGRNDTTKYALSHAEVLRVLSGRLERSRQLSGLLDREAERDPVPADKRSTAHLHVVASPTLGRQSMLQDAIDSGDTSWPRFLQEKILGGPAGVRSGQRWSPDVSMASTVSRRASGWALHSYQMGEDRRLRPNGDPQWREGSLLDLEVDEDGSVHLYCGRASDYQGNQPFIIEMVVAGLTCRAVRAAQTIADTMSYLGPWYIGVVVTGLRGVLSYKRSQAPTRLGVPYSEDRYAEGAEFTAAELSKDLWIVDRLLGRLWRGAGSDFTATELGL